MPQTKKQEIVYTVMMVCVMVYGMVCYNIALDVAGCRIHLAFEVDGADGARGQQVLPLWTGSPQTVPSPR